MLRRSILLALIAALVAVAPSAAADQTRIKSYCSDTGDVCYGIFKNGSVYSFRLTLAAKYFQRYRICVRPLGQQATCKSFPVKKTGAAWGGTVFWQRNFPVRGPTRLPCHVVAGSDTPRPAAHVLPAGSDLIR
jgi:hypothetical protein